MTMTTLKMMYAPATTIKMAMTTTLLTRVEMYESFKPHQETLTVALG